MPRRAALPAALLAMTLALPGCIERTIYVTTEPPGARVWLNDVELGRTPVQTAFTFYGDYDIQIQMDGYEPLQTCRSAKAPVHEWPGIDLVAEALPHRFQNEIHWHFDLEPDAGRVMPAEQLDARLLDRASELEAQLDDAAPAAHEPAPDDDAPADSGSDPDPKN